MARKTKKLWQGRFAAPPSRVAEEFTSSLGFDRRLWSYDLRGSEVHCQMLARQGIVPRRDAERILEGLARIRKEFLSGRFRFQPSDEDIHTAIERRLTEIVGAAGGHLHTARSRNDQVVLDVRLYLKEAIGNLRIALADVRDALARLARTNLDVVMPGYTHMQRAQPVLLAHHLLAYYDMLGRDDERYADCRSRVDLLPLGAGALAGVPYPIDRAFVAQQLGFHRIAENSIDAVSDRDFIAEFLAATAILFVHLSRLCADLTLWASSEFGFVAFPDEFSTGSSIMPQKKNPDVAELVRGKSGRVFGGLQAVLTVMKGLPLAYQSDLQEDKEPMFDAADTALAALKTVAAMLPGLRFDGRRMREAACGFLLATELADFLVEKGLPFRQAHGVAGAVVRHCLKTGRQLEQLSLAELRRFSPRFDRGVLERLTPEAAVARRRAPGGTARENVERRLDKIGIQT
ncbi:MAG: argininosuccinate lyase [Deltaproteobacteria bacterium]|nr:argininosuccinate lyase [Deltaproteobacteria bacterium]